MSAAWFLSGMFIRNCILSTGNKSSEKKLSELEDSQGKVETELQEKITSLEKEVENANTRLADFKRRGAVFTPF